MVELEHGDAIPKPMVDFLTQYPDLEVEDFESDAFNKPKKEIKKILNGLQGGICVYCETILPDEHGHVEHIIPKKGPQAARELCFVYSNYAHSCTTRGRGELTCGMKKGHNRLPIEPRKGCNKNFNILTNGEIVAALGLPPNKEKSAIDTTLILGLNKPALVNERKVWIKRVIELRRNKPALVSSYLERKPFRFILNCILFNSEEDSLS